MQKPKYLAIFIAILTFFGGLWVGKTQFVQITNGEQVIVDKEKGKPQEVDFSLFWETWAELEDKFADKSKIDKQEMVYGAIDGMVKSLGDPYTAFMDPKETERFNTDISGSFEGIGAEIGIRNNMATIIAPLPGTPAEKAGLRSGDKVLKVGDAITADLTLDEVVDLIRGPKGTAVKLTIMRGDSSAPEAIEITRGKIDVPSLRSEMGDDKIGIIHFYQFSEDANKEFKKAANEIISGGAKGLIIDLRNNPGGYLNSSVDIASLFVEKGKIVVSEEYADGSKTDHKAEGGDILNRFPTVVLINEGSASASEIVAGALKDNNGIKLVGKKTFGKGSVQQLEPLKGGSSLKVTVAKWLTPSGICINSEGIKPDIEVEFTEEDYDSGRDPQMDKAKEILASPLLEGGD